MFLKRFLSRTLSRKDKALSDPFSKSGKAPTSLSFKQGGHSSISVSREVDDPALGTTRTRDPLSSHRVCDPSESTTSAVPSDANVTEVEMFHPDMNQQTPGTAVQPVDLAKRFYAVEFEEASEATCYTIWFCSGCQCHPHCESDRTPASCRKLDCHSSCASEHENEQPVMMDDDKLRMDLSSPLIFANHIRSDGLVDVKSLSKYLEQQSEPALSNTQFQILTWNSRDRDTKRQVFNKIADEIGDPSTFLFKRFTVLTSLDDLRVEPTLSPSTGLFELLGDRVHQSSDPASASSLKDWLESR